ncbi:hypothetical protein BN7_4854 [Wickerhamomyces ciferrii]|uniref:N-acetylglucosaminylphosphatidylinositol deacetylase n=1 Tax=Wickerhamomyces ciferrii (strain ATCC 14091 / BCRC 22168 / CBS 111 / JCM 3599 / NBRC 0793 / NRRL Y-1031 F-60-10) TaxID=1206466 RepID=K0KTE0_WICCF|nr:uncharacterized protein BN7_4854 [Wickerhamomyces ciferrii]CCH45272.1 hypothetical protein BN7_4854 [Wickerhamomyces ciferrii]
MPKNVNIEIKSKTSPFTSTSTSFSTEINKPKRITRSILQAMGSYFLRKAKGIVLLLFTSFLFWAILTTSIQELDTSFKLNKIPEALQNKHIQLLIAHPDDEVMFFAPTLVELSKARHNNTISATCLSIGNDQGLGPVRQKELERSFQILGIHDYEIVNDENSFKDSMNITWDSDKVAEYILEKTDVVLTFDEFGISNHPNHKSLYYGSLKTNKSVFSLKTWNFLEKYSATIYTNIELLLRIISLIAHIVEDQLKPHGLDIYLPIEYLRKLHHEQYQNVHIFADLPSSILGIAAMTNAHHSQMVWFRWGWLIVSKYSNSNELIQIQ